MHVSTKPPGDASVKGNKTLEALSYSLQEPMGKALFSPLYR